MKNILVTRPAHQAEPLCNLLQTFGCHPIRFPLLALEPLDLNHSNLKWLDTLPSIDWLIFVSVNAVKFALAGNNGKIRKLCTKTQLAAVGKATAGALIQEGLTVNLVPITGFNSEALLASPELSNVRGQHIVCVRGVGGRDILAEALSLRKAEVHYLEVYRRMLVQNDLSEVLNLLATQALDVLMVTSGEALNNLFILFKECPYWEQMKAIPVVVISERLRLLAADYGFKKVEVSDDPSDSAVFKTIISLVGGENRG